MMNIFKIISDLPNRLDFIGKIISDLDHSILSLRDEVRVAHPKRRIVFIWGTARKIDGTEILQVVAEPEYLEMGKRTIISFSPLIGIHEIKIQVNEPFLIRDVQIGRDSFSASNGAARIWEIPHKCTVANKMTIHVEWLME